MAGTSPAMTKIESTPESRRPVCNSPEIIQDDVQIGLGGRRAIQVRVDDPATGLDGRMIPEIVRCLQNDPGRIRGFVGVRFIGSCAEALACNCGGWDCVHLRYFPAIPDW